MANDLNSAEVGYSYDDEVVEDCPLLSLPNYVPVKSSMMPTPPFDIFLRPSFKENQKNIATSTQNTTTNLDNVIDSPTTKSSSALSNYSMHFSKNEHVSKNIMNFCDKINENE